MAIRVAENKEKSPFDLDFIIVLLSQINFCYIQDKLQKNLPEHQYIGVPVREVC
jgi:hypothetical protein